MMWRGMLLVTSNDTGRSVALVSVKWIGLSGGCLPSLLLPFIMQLFFLGGGKLWRVCSTPAFSQSAGSGDRCKKMSHGIKGIEKTFTLHNHFFSVTVLCFVGFTYCLLHYY